MENYRIVTDSTADLTPEMVEELGVQVIPLEFVLDGKSYFNYPDGRELSSKKFYDLLRAGNMATTVQVNTARFIEVFEPLLQEGGDVLYIAFSSGLSGTYSSAVLAAEELKERYPERRVAVVDSLAASMGEGLLVYHAVMRQRAGMNLDALEKWLLENRNHLCHWFTVDDLFFLKRGGRVSATTAVLGTILTIKPVMHMDDNGRLIPVAKERGRKRALRALVDHMEETAIDPQNQTVFISHGDCLEDAQFVEQQVRERLGVKDVLIHYVEPVIGAHSGPGTVALFFLGTHR